MKVKTMKWINRVANILLTGLFLIVATLVITSAISDGEPQLFGKELKVVYSGSMEPGIKTGSLIGIETNINKNALQTNDVIMFQSEPTVYVTHRIIDVVNRDGEVFYQTKGDNNTSPDANLVPSENVYGLHETINLPYLGYAVDFANSSLAIALLLILPGIFLVISSIKTIVITLRDSRSSQKELTQNN